MNNNYSNSELIYKKRLIINNIMPALKSFPVIVITGARQVGKSTFLKNEFKDFKYINFDDYSNQEQAKKDPSSLWRDYDHIIIDEVQKVPEVLNAVKLNVDGTNKNIRFILSGSSNLLLMKNVSETLAGRAAYFEMQPMTYAEIQERGEGLFYHLWEKDFNLKETDNLKSVQADYIPLIFKGFMPPLLNLNGEKEVVLWWESYVRTYLERDLRELSQIESLIDFRKVMVSLALRTGNLLNQSEIARDSGISQPSVHRYLKLLEISNIIKQIPAFYSNKIKRIMKMPKIFFVDPALSVYLSGYYDISHLGESRELGSFFETMVYLHLKVYSELMTPKSQIFYYKTTTGKEVDFIVEHGREIVAFEVKMTDNPTFEDAKNIIEFIENFPNTISGIIVHSGNSIKRFHSKVIAVPWQML
ncbi:MAG: ATP-binding protein [Candidatus Acidulodesulfobacterium sp.]